MSFKTNITDDVNGLQVRCDIMPYDVCGKIVSMSERGCGLFSRNRFDLHDKVELHVLLKDNEESCVVRGVITNVSHKGDGKTADVWDKDDGWVYSVSLSEESDAWKDVVWKFMMSHK